MLVKETATRQATRSFLLRTRLLLSPVSTIQMLLTNSTTGTKGTIEMSTQEFATFLKYIYQHFLHPFLKLFIFEIKPEIFFNRRQLLHIQHIDVRWWPDQKLFKQYVCSVRVYVVFTHQHHCCKSHTTVYKMKWTYRQIFKTQPGRKTN